MSIPWAVLFWIAFSFVAYAYVGYPAVLALWRRLRPRPAARGPYQPPVTLILAVHDEAAGIEAKVHNCRSLDYPADRLRLIVALDGCTDDTEARLRRQAGPDLEVVCLPERRGKAAALNAAIEQATGEVLVFVDVRQRIEAGALGELLAPLADPSVGVVSGELVLLRPDGREAREGIGLYWRYEKWVRALESDVHSVVGATGALYAVRRELVTPLPEGTLLDDVLIPMRAVLQGRRCLLEPRARVLDRVACCDDAEYRRKVRTLAGNFQLLTLMPELLHPLRNPVWLQFVSHKVARLLVPYALALLLLSNVFLSGPFYGTFLVLQALFYALAVLGDSLAKTTQPMSARSEA